MKFFAITLLFSLIPGAATAKPLWECPYSNFIMDNAGNCISLEYMVRSAAPRTAIAQHPFPDWLIVFDKQYEEILAEKTTFELDYGNNFFLSGYENRWAMLSTYLEGTLYTENIAEMAFFDCKTGWTGTYVLPAGETDSTKGIYEFRSPSEAINPATTRQTCLGARITPQF